MPGFILAKTVYQMAKHKNWDELEGIILLKHGIFTFDDDAKKSYDKMIDAVTKAQLIIDVPPIDLKLLKEYNEAIKQAKEAKKAKTEKEFHQKLNEINKKVQHV